MSKIPMHEHACKKSPNCPIKKCDWLQCNNRKNLVCSKNPHKQKRKNKNNKVNYNYPASYTKFSKKILKTKTTQPFFSISSVIIFKFGIKPLFYHLFFLDFFFTLGFDFFLTAILFFLIDFFAFPFFFFSALLDLADFFFSVFSSSSAFSSEMNCSSFFNLEISFSNF